MKKIILLLILCFAVNVNLFAGAGTSTGVFLKMIPGARPAGMGDTFVAIADDVNSIYINPGGLFQLKRPEIAASHAIWIEDITNTNISYVRPSNNNAFGFGITYMSLGDVETTDTSGNLLSEKSSVYNSVISFVYSMQVADNIGLGISAKNIIQKYGSYSGNGIAFDLSGLLKFGDFSTGMAIQNISSGMKIDGVANSLPATFKLGFAYNIIPELKAGLDFDKSTDSDMKIHTGIEYLAGSSFVLRGGFNQIDKFSTTQGWTIGIGTKSSLAKKSTWGGEENISAAEGMELDFDYAITTFGEDLGNTHRISITLKFANPANPREQ